MQENISILIENIKNCNLSDEDKLILLKKLETKNPDIEDFLKTFLSICNVSEKVLKLFEYDIWSIF